MCGIIFSYSRMRRSEAELAQANINVKRRGPDHTDVVHRRAPSGNWVTMVHSLLDISGRATSQPYVSAGGSKRFLIFNGEIYNYQNFSALQSDTEVILPAVELNSEKFFQDVRGEFAILIYDECADTLDLYTDPFLTKPIFIGRSDVPCELGVASYASALKSLGYNQVHTAEPNTHYHFKLSRGGFSLVQKFPMHSFSFFQNETSYDKFFECLIESVRLRACHGAHAPALSLSSGYDSGAICLALNILNIPYTTVSVNSGESEEVMGRRLAINANKNIPHISISPLDKKNMRQVKEKIKSEVESYSYSHSDGNGLQHDLSNDSGAIGAYLVAERLRNMGLYVNLSGSGADEIYSDYGFAGVKLYPHSEFGGLFPDDLEGFFPWRKFYGDTQRSYLFKEEIIFGHFGVESRYPLLDRELVQEFLALTPELKNKQYKAPIAAFLQKYNYPFELNQKRGFSAKDLSFGRKLKRGMSRIFNDF